MPRADSTARELRAKQLGVPLHPFADPLPFNPDHDEQGSWVSDVVLLTFATAVAGCIIALGGLIFIGLVQF